MPADLAELAAAAVKQSAAPTSQNERSILATLAAEGLREGPTTWSYSYHADGVPHVASVREDARRHVSGAELLSLCREAAFLAARRLKGKHGIPALETEEIADLASELATLLLEDAAMLAAKAAPLTDDVDAPTATAMPRRERLTRAYLVKRAQGIVLNDPARKRTEAGADMDPAELAAHAEGEAEARSRSGRDGADRMLEPGTGSEWPSSAAAAEAVGLTLTARRAAAYLIGGGKVRGDWSLTWNVTEGMAATKIVPTGTAQLKDKLSDRAIRQVYLDAAAPHWEADDADHRDRALREQMRGGGAAGDVSRARAAMTGKHAWRDRIAVGDRQGTIGPAVPDYVLREGERVSEPMRELCRQAGERTRDHAPTADYWHDARI